MATRYEQIWERRVPDSVLSDIHDRTGYSAREIRQAHLEIFLNMPGIEDEAPRIRYALWTHYVDVMVKGNVSTEDRRDFFADVGTHYENFEWSDWREAMGYPRR